MGNSNLELTGCYILHGQARTQIHGKPACISFAALFAGFAYFPLLKELDISENAYPPLSFYSLVIRMEIVYLQTYI